MNLTQSKFAGSVLWALLLVSLMLAVASLLLVTGRPIPLPQYVRDYFTVTGELNAWSWFNSSLLLMAGIVFAGVALVNWSAQHSLPVFSWLVASAILVAMSLDDASMLHEHLEGLGVSMGGGAANSFLVYAWVIPGFLLAAMVVSAFWVVMRGTTQPVRLSLVTGLALFFGGALGVETLAGIEHHTHQSVTAPSFILLSHLEETLEAFGTVVFIYAGLSAVRFDRTADGVAVSSVSPAR